MTFPFIPMQPLSPYRCKVGALLALFLWLCGVPPAANSQVRSDEMRVARGNEDYPPYEMRVDGKLAGLHIEVIETVAAKMGYTVSWQELPWMRAQRCAELGECDAISYISPSPAREQWGIFLPQNVLSQVEMRFMVHKDDADKLVFNGNVPEFLGNRKLLSLIGYNYGPDVAKADKHEVKDLATMVAMMKFRRHEVAIINSHDFAGLKAREDLVLLHPPVWVSKAYIAFSKKAHPAGELAAQFEESYMAFKKTKEYAAIAQRYASKAK